MRWPTLALTAVLASALVGCGSDQEETPPGQPAATPEQAAPTQPAAPPPAQPTATPPPRPTQTRPAQTTAALMNQPWTPVHTGTVSEGMTRDDVIGVWGPPVAERVVGARGYLYFRNGCEVTCGTFDVVFLDGGRVVDAIVRGQGHMFDGASSSPPGRQAMPTLPGQQT
ncbi:MAG: hypothetical protein OEO20_08460 [Gemmatimonadota bacterium]|nr:hypothetical protein [Gemmatimonadota bacterium]MDH3367013.1 hypothetical protein [Gemmatimonadota bacterium]MDH3478320.1 hypothetical protein [Gemmatimonadota bacterium]MDH5550252.1 hypothetical protein [Gemmatimonadota bacterium]